MAQVTDSHSYLQQNYNIPTIPPSDSKLKGLKKIVAKCIAYFTNAQNEFNANVVRTFNSIHLQLEESGQRTDILNKKISDIAQLLNLLQTKQNDLYNFHSQLNVALIRTEKMQSHHGAIIENYKDKISYNSQIINEVQNNIKDAIIQLDLVNKDVAGLDNRQNDLTDILNKSFNQLDNRQDDLAQKANIDFENLNNRQDDLAKKAVVNFENLNNRQDDLAKKATVNFENLNNRQDDLAKKANIDFEKLNNRQDDLAKKTIGDFENLNNRQDDLAKKATVNFENLNNRQNDLTKITTSSVAQLNNRQNDINKVVLDFTKNSKAQTKNITSIANRLTLSEQGFIELRKLLNEFSQQTSLLSSSLNTVLTNFSSNKSKSKLQTSLIKLNDLCNEMNYASYENVFRGSDKLITERLSYYLKFLKNIKTSNKNYVLDLGCGRGEFVEMLNKNKINALGVDLNKSSVEHAKSKNINVKQADIFKVLKSATPKTLPAISAFHLVEHLTFPELESFLQLTATRLKPGGILLIETPNILNLQVAASDFYKDPTHIRPVHPSMLEYWLKFSGFSKIKIDFLHPFPENERLTIQKGSKIIDKNFDKLNNLIFGARDCAIIAVK